MLAPGSYSAGPEGAGVLHRQLLIPADEAQPGVARERARQQSGFAQHLKTVADAEDRQPVVGRLHHLGDDGENRAIAPARR